MSKKKSVIFIDDDPDIINLLNAYLKNYQELEVKGKFTNPLQALEWLEEKASEVDAVFLDLIMPEMHGLDVAEKIQSLSHDIKIVFITAHSDYAVQAFELNSLDYLLKPVTRERLKKSVDRLMLLPPKKTIKDGSFPKVYIQFFDEFNIFIIEGSQKKALDWSTQKTKETCAYLAHNYIRWVKREEVISAIWPEQDYEKSRVNLYSRVYNIKQLFQDAGLKGLIKSSKNGYKLELPPEIEWESDLGIIENLINQEKEITEENIGEFEKGLKLLTGSYMEKDYYSWTTEKQQQIDMEIVKLLHKMADYNLEKGDVAKQEEVFRKAIKLAPDAEWCYHVLIKLYLQQGKRVEAMKVYRKLEETIKTELGLEPDEKTRQLLKEITKQD